MLKVERKVVESLYQFVVEGWQPADQESFINAVLNVPGVTQIDAHFLPLGEFYVTVEAGRESESIAQIERIITENVTCRK